MVMLRHPNPMDHTDAAASQPGGAPGAGSGAGSGRRLNVLLTSGDWHDETWADRLPVLLEPMGVRALRAHSGSEASRILRADPVHVAVVDLALPLDASTAGGRGGAGQGAEAEGGYRLLEILSRQPSPPPTVVVKRRKTMREDAREVARALSTGAFAVIERPVHIEIVLETLRRVLTRHYRGCWPDDPGGAGLA